MGKSAAKGQSKPAAAEQDRYRDLEEVLSVVRTAAASAEGQVERVTVELTAAGEGAWRVWEKGADEPLGGYVPPPDRG